MICALDDFFAEQDWELLQRINHWSVQRDGENQDLVWFRLYAADSEQYVVRCECSNYPNEAPSVAFVNEAGSKTDPCAWPIGDAEFDQIVKPPNNCFLCTSLTREGLAHHPDWRNQPAKNPWDARKNTLLDVFNLLHRLLNSSHYQGRRRA